ncbi:MAG: hypothetical protein Q8K75_10780 [Chlamydiales bacterium]|nr:hypothetical protein [Chlamydiales bacterium]
MLSQTLQAKLAVVLSCCAIALSGMTFLSHRHVVVNLPEGHAEEYSDVLLERVELCIRHNQPQSHQEEMLALIQQLKENGSYCEEGSDDFRVKFVGSQGTIEHVLACAQALGEIHHLVGVIHTPTPATPLCTYPNEDPSLGLLDETIANDSSKVLTVRSRAQIVREYLHKNGTLYITYPHGGLEKRSPEQQEIYAEALLQFPNNLIDWVLNSDNLPNDQIGATYLFRDNDDNVYAFSIKSTQAREPLDTVLWGLWFGAISNPAVSERVTDVFDYLDSINGPNIRTDFEL